MIEKPEWREEMTHAADLCGLAAVRAIQMFSKQQGSSGVSMFSIPHASLLRATAVDLTANDH